MASVTVNNLSACASARPVSAPGAHLLDLPGGEWCLWRWIAVRGAGFPLRQVLSLASTEAARAADSLLDANLAAEQARLDLLACLRRDLKSAPTDNRKRLSKTIDRLNKRAIQPKDIPASTIEACYFREASDLAHDADDFYQASYREAVNQTSNACRRFARDSRFREALTWQNRKLLHEAIRPLLSRVSAPISHSTRRKEELIANYAQRYCTKNETIGFFGPVGWGRFSSTAPALSVHPGPGLLDSREVFFEQWCIDALADSLASDPAMRPWLIPRTFPNHRLDGHSLLQPMEETRTLSPSESVLFSCCSGRLSARQIADTLLSRPNPVFSSQQQIFDLLARWQDLNIITWGFEVGMQLHPEQALRKKLEDIGDEDLRGAALGRLDELEHARDEIAVAAGDPQRLDSAIQRLEETFTRITGAAATRFEGRTYAGRTLVYEDCRRDLSLEVGPELLERLGPPLTLLLQSVRWMTSDAAAAYESAFGEIFDQLSARSGGREVDAYDLWLHAQRLIFGRRTSLLELASSKLREKWKAVLKLDYSQREQRYSCEQLHPEVVRAFPATRSGWRAGRYHSPDLMVSSPSLNAIRSGNYQLILGELHVGINTLGAGSFSGQHPDPDRLFDAVAADFDHPRILPVTPRSFPKNTSRTSPAFVTEKDYWLEAGEEASNGLRARTLPISALVVRRNHRGLIVQSRDGHLTFEILDLFGELLNMMASNSFKIIEAAPHVPRVSFDNLVVCRESWSVPAEDLSFATHKDPAARFLFTRRWRRQLQIPRFAFVKVPVEVKPFFVDFDSPILVNLLLKSVKRCLEQEEPCTITFSEMLPNPEQVWLPDANGERYSSELRIVALDPAT